MLADDLEKALPGRVERERTLTRLSTLGVGGRAECYLEPASLDDFRAVLALKEKEGFPLYILGGGSNVVVADGLIPGLVLSTRRWNAVSWEGDCAEVQAGHPLASLVEETGRRGLGGLEFAIGIPGTMGGAASGNAGAGGLGVGDLLTEVTTLEPGGDLRRWARGEFSCSYRRFSLEGHLLLEFRMKFPPASPEDGARRERFRARREGQPSGERSAGCSFKNPTGESAGALLDRCECKGLSAGDAVVSERHANFILNRGNATAADVVSLLRTCQERVLEAFGVRLEPELKFLGFEGSPLEGNGGERSRVCAGG